MYSSIYKNIIFPFYETILMRRKTIAYLDELEKNQWLSIEALEGIQWQKLLKLLNHAYDNVPYYRRRFNEAGLTINEIKNPSDFAKIPFLTKDDIRANKDDLIAKNYKNSKMFDSTTGGSTGTPLRFKLDHNNYEWRQAAIKRVYGWSGYSDGEKTVFIWGAGVHKGSLKKKWKHDLDETLKRHKIYNTFYFSEETMPRYANEINRFKPGFIIAYTSPLYNFARYVKDKAINIWTPKAIIVGAEKLFPAQRGVIKEVFRAPVFETYGCREVTSIAGECEMHNGMHINMENIYLEIVKDSCCARSGEDGEIVVTDLTNYAMPFIRYKNEDIGALSEEKCSCGRSLKLLKNVQGRILDTIRTADGRSIPGEFFIYWFMNFDEIKRFQVVQDSIDRLVIKIAPSKEISAERIDLLRSIIFKIMGDKISIDFEFVDEIPLTESGKYRVVVSKVQPELVASKI